MDARITRTRTAVMEAATELLLEGGPTAITMDGVVARSGVAKSTLYRHWPTRDALVASVFTHIAPELPEPDPSLPFEDALRVLAHAFVDIVADPYWVRLIPAMLLLKADLSEIAQLDAELQKHQSDVLAPVLACGAAEGLLPEGYDTELEATLLIGPILMAALTGSTPLTREFADRCVDHFLAGIGAHARA
ncbi:TetR/AcrR family transcriptional regulator [Aquihabitans sp. G128]|uniref:TetR/AcrR family transcriptional regulator n=1 Tax=Aquihabitans sp. G128 TaxID=2849779 RepID=UPI001C23D5FC|nr:TetR/AcrR family transcriptional regulator [Aquihabitans sp. G128]QXC59723.1 TetR/AcrR family transcriptional regulator [Aquihabitans sp. G128]